MKSLSYSFADDEFKNIIKESTSCADAMRKMGYMCTTGNANRTVHRRIKELNIGISHWVDNLKNAHKKNYIPNEKYFVNGKNRSGTGIRKRIIKYNIKPYICEICGNTGEWNGKKLILQIDHINGTHSDNRIENLRFLCPNCHSQTDTFAGKNVK